MGTGSLQTYDRPDASPITRLGCSLLLGAVSLFTLVCSGLIALGSFVTAPAVFVVAVFLATLFTVPYVVMVLWLDRHEKEPVRLLLASFAWGALGATAISSLGNTFSQAVFLEAAGNAAVAQQLTASFSAPPFEETTKAFALLAVLLLVRDELDNVLDGIVYGAVVGLGFAWFENILYYLQAGQQGLESMLQLTWLRGALSGLGTHATFTALTGVGFGLFKVRRSGLLRWLLPPLFLGLAMFAHFSWNTFAGLIIAGFDDPAGQLLVGAPLAVLMLQAPFMVLVAVIVGLTWRHEDELIRLFLEDEDEDVVPRSEIRRLISSRARLAHQLGVARRRGLRAGWRRRRLDEELIELAFSKWHHARDPRCDWPLTADREVLGLRGRILELRAA